MRMGVLFAQVQGTSHVRQHVSAARLHSSENLIQATRKESDKDAQRTQKLTLDSTPDLTGGNLGVMIF